MAPRPDSIPFNPASILVRLAAMETAMGMDNMYINPTLGGAIQIRGKPASQSRINFSLEESITRSSTIPTIPTRRITSKVMISWNCRSG
jgi:hypothetical protein